MYLSIAVITFYGLMIAGNIFTAYYTEKFCYHKKNQFLGKKGEISQ